MMTESDARRYSPGREFYYDLAFAAESRLSRVFNGPGNDLGSLQRLLKATEEGLQASEDNLSDLLEAQKQARQIAFNKGTKWKEDDRTREKRVKIEAMIDVHKWEVITLNEAIEEAESEKEEHDLPPCLPRGPEGLNQVRGSTGSGYVDGQWVEPVNGIPCIVDERSRYRGMAVFDYTEYVSKPWKRACAQRTKHMRKQLLAEGKKEEQLKRRYAAPWPAWPEEVKNHFQEFAKTLTPTEAVK